MTPPGPIALVINPVATRSRATERAEVTRHLSRLGLEWSLLTQASGDAGRLASQAVAEGARVVVSLGGDGTAAEVAAALAGSDVAMARAPGRQRERVRARQRLAGVAADVPAPAEPGADRGVARDGPSGTSGWTGTPSACS